MLLLALGSPAWAGDALNDYVARLRQDKAGPVKETGFMSAGSDFLYGQDYFEAGNYSSAVGYFRDALRKDERNAFARYQLGVSLLRQSDPTLRAEAKQHLDAAVALNPELRARYAADFATPQPTAAVGGPAVAPPVTPAAAVPTAAAEATASLEAYMARLQASRARGGNETAMGTAGNAMLYGYEYFQAKDYPLAASRFQQALALEPQRPEINYLLAVSLAAQGKDTEASALQSAFAARADLQGRFAADVRAAKAAWQVQIDAKAIKTAPRQAEPAPGGVLVFGNYTCSKTVWNGPNRTPAFRSEYQGYFELKADGTYRWLDNGPTGKYHYEAKTGAITWVSGHFKDQPQSTVFRRRGPSGEITINFTDSYRWTCYCEKK